MKRTIDISTALLVTMVAVFAAGCGSPARQADASKPDGIVMWLVGSEGQAQTIREIAQEFTKKTGIKVRCEAISWGEAHSKYLTSIAGGVAPDIGTMGLTWGMEFGSLGVMVDLAEAYPGDTATIKGMVFPGMWNSVDYRGKVYGIPFDMTEYILYYRNDIVPVPPATWEALTALLTELGKKNKGMIFDWGSLSWIGYSPFLWQAGGDFFNADYMMPTVDTAQAVTGMKFFCDLYTAYGVPKTKIPLEQGMRTGDFPLAISGNWKIEALSLTAPEIAGKWSIALLPRGPGGRKTTFIGGRIMGIFAQSRHQQEAWDFIKFLFAPATQMRLYHGALLRQDTYLPPNIAAWDLIEMDPVFKIVLTEQARDAKGPPPVLDWDSNTKYIDQVIQKTVLQGADPQKELEAANRELARRYAQK